MGRTMPTECPHGFIIDWADFGCEDCWEGTCPDGHHNDPQSCDECGPLMHPNAPVSISSGLPNACCRELSGQVEKLRKIIALQNTALDSWVKWERALRVAAGFKTWDAITLRAAATKHVLSLSYDADESTGTCSCGWMSRVMAFPGSVRAEHADHISQQNAYEPTGRSDE